MKTGDETIDGVKTFSSTIAGNLTGNVTGDLTGDIIGNTKVILQPENALIIEHANANFDGETVDIEFSQTGTGHRPGIGWYDTDDSSSGEGGQTRGLQFFYSKIGSDDPSFPSGQFVGMALNYSGLNVNKRLKINQPSPKPESQQPEYYLDVVGDTRLNGELEVSGNVGLNTAVSATRKLDIKGQVRIYDFNTVSGTTTLFLQDAQSNHNFIKMGIKDSDVGNAYKQALIGFNNSNQFTINTGSLNTKDVKISGGDLDVQGTTYSSDSRIKDNIIDVTDDVALQIVRDIPCHYYTYRDTELRGTQQTIGFIAQEVKAVFPMAVKEKTKYIPDEYRLLTSENTVWTGLNLKITDLTVSAGDKYQFLVSNNEVDIDLQILNEERNIVANQDGSFTFEKQWEKIFLYGSQVDDFHMIDKNKIFTVHHAAIQEVDRIQQTLQTENTQLKTRVETLETQLADVLTRISALEND